MKRLKINGKSAHNVNGKFVKSVNEEDVFCGYVLIPTNIHTLKADFTGDGVKETYKVIRNLSSSKQIHYELMPTQDFRASRFYNVNSGVTVAFSNGIEGLQFNGSLVDSTLNLYYAQLNVNVKRCIVPRYKTQKMWNYTYIPTEEEYQNRENGFIYGSIDDNKGYYKLTNTGGYLDMGYKNIYTLSLDDIFEYYNIQPKNDNSDIAEHSSTYEVGQTIHVDTDKIYFNVEKESEFIKSLELLMYNENAIVTGIDSVFILTCDIWNNSGICAIRDRRDPNKTIYGILQVGYRNVPLYSTEDNNFVFGNAIHFEKGYNNLESDNSYAWKSNGSPSNDGEVLNLSQEWLWNGTFIGQTNEFIQPRATDTITYDAIYDLFWDRSSSEDISKSVWLSDAAYRMGSTENENLNKNAMFFANRQYGNLINYHYYNEFKVRPVFTIDLLKYVDEYGGEIEIVD